MHLPFAGAPFIRSIRSDSPVARRALPRCGHVGAANALKALRAKLRSSSRGDDGVPHRRSLVQHTETAAFRRLQPFVRAGGVTFAAQLVHVQPHHSTTCAPSTAERMPFERANAQSSFAADHACDRGDMAEEQHARPRVIASLNRFITPPHLHRLRSVSFSPRSISLRAQIQVLASGAPGRSSRLIARLHVQALAM